MLFALLLLLQESTTDHYSLHAETVDAKDLGAMLEEHHKLLTAFFGASPKEKQLRVEVYADQKAWAAAMKRDGEAAEGAGGYYSPRTKKAYLWVQPSEYYTRQLILHETTHQFHYLAGTRNEHVDLFWFVEGLAEYFGMHNWDGKTLKTGVVPAIALEDYPGKALAQFDALMQDLAGIAAGTTACERPVGWALVHFLATNHLKRFRAFAELANAKDPDAWKKALGPVTSEVVKQFRAWIEGHQQPWRIVWTAWQERGEFLEGRSEVNGLALRASKPASMQVELKVEGKTQAGVLFGFVSAEEFHLAQIDASGGARVVRRTKGAWKTITSIARPKAERDVLELSREGRAVKVVVNGASLGSYETAGEWGLNVDGGRVLFRVKETR